MQWTMYFKSKSFECIVVSTFLYKIVRTSRHLEYFLQEPFNYNLSDSFSLDKQISEILHSINKSLICWLVNYQINQPSIN